MKSIIFLLFTIGMMVAAPFGLYAQSVKVSEKLATTERIGNVIKFVYDVSKDSIPNCSTDTCLGTSFIYEVPKVKKQICINVANAKNISDRIAFEAYSNPGQAILGNKDDQLEKSNDTKSYGGVGWIFVSGTEYDNSYYQYESTTKSIEPVIVTNHYTNEVSPRMLFYWILFFVYLFWIILDLDINRFSTNDFTFKGLIGGGEFTLVYFLAIIFFLNSLISEIYYSISIGTTNWMWFIFLVLYLILLFVSNARDEILSLKNRIIDNLLYIFNILSAYAAMIFWHSRNEKYALYMLIIPVVLIIIPLVPIWINSLKNTKGYQKLFG